MADLSILIPARNEMWLKRTIEDILEHIESDTEILVGLDGSWADPVIEDHSRVTILHTGVSIGQRAMTNRLAKLSKARYVMKVDAHCSFDQGFDRKMIAFFKEHGHDMIAVPVMRNLHVFDWVCEDGHRRYQGPSGPCAECGKPTTMDVVWIPKTRPESTSYCFDAEPHFQYFRDYTRRPEYKDMKEKHGYTETMSLQGSCFMVSRHNYWKYEVCDERAGSWGNQGIELACSAWLSGLRVLVNHNTWYAHLFRTQGGDFGFPYEQSGREVEKTKKYIRDKFWEKKHPKQIHDVQWLVDKFAPVPGWEGIGN